MKLDDLRPEVRVYLEKFGVEKWLSQYGLELCRECGQIGLHFKSAQFYEPKAGRSYVVAGWLHREEDMTPILSLLNEDSGATPEVSLSIMGAILSRYFRDLAYPGKKEARVCGDVLLERKEECPLELCPNCDCYGWGVQIMQHKVRGEYRSEKPLIIMIIGRVTSAHSLRKSNYHRKRSVRNVGS